MTVDRETLAKIIEAFEFFLISKEIDTSIIPNEEREDDPNAALIYGSDYYNLAAEISNVLNEDGVHVSEAYATVIRPKDRSDMLVIYVPEYDDIIRIDEGSGGNLLKEDIAAGYVDYINYSVIDAENVLDDTEARDGGMCMYKEYISDKYASLSDLVEDVIAEIYNKTDVTWIKLSGGDAWEVSK